MVKKNSLVKNASILMIATIISRIIGLIYRRPLGEILGSVGLGYYGYASNLYSILLLVSSYSIPMAVSKIVSERLAKKEYKNAQKIFKTALLYAVIVGGAAALVAFFGGSILLPSNQQNALPALRVLAPTIFLSAILGVLRGYFQAHHNMTPTSISQVLEQIMNAVVSILAAWILVNSLGAGSMEKTAVYGAVGGTLGTSAGVIVGLIFMLFVYFLNKKTFRKRYLRDIHGKEDSYRDAFGLIFLMVTPIILTTFINNASNYLDSYLYAGIQGMHGINANSISAAYGEFSNYYIPVINIPLALASASTSAMMPEVSGYFAVGDNKSANSSINKTIKLTMFICIPATVGLTVLAHPIMGVLFPAASDVATKLLVTGSLYVVFTALCTVTGGALQSIGKQRTALINAAVALGINLASLAVMLLVAPGLDIYAVMISGIIFSVAYCILNEISIKKYLGFKARMKDTYVNPLIASAFMAVVAAVIYYLIFFATRRPFIGLIISVIAAVAAYLVFYVLFGRIPEEELRRYPMGTKLVKIMRLIRVYR